MRQTSPNHKRNWLARIALVTGLIVLTAGCHGTWGVRKSYRDYITSPIADGTITAQGGATWLDGAGSGKGPFQWPVESSTFNPVTKKGTVQFKGTVSTVGHETPDGYVLDITFTRPRLVINGNNGTLYVDLTYRPFEGTAPVGLPALQNATNVSFARLDLSTQNWTTDSEGYYQITSAPAVGVNAAMKRIGWDQFYGLPVALDAFTARFKPA